MTQLEDPTLSQVLNNAIRAQLLDMHTAMPGKVLEYDINTQSARIQPLLKRKFIVQEKEVDLPIINSVPVVFFGGANSIVHDSLVEGDTGLIVFSERSIDSWLSGDGQSVSPDDPKTHDLSDAIFFPGLKSFSQVISGLSDTNMTLKKGDMTIELDPSGKISITGASEELVSVITDFSDHVLTFIGNVKAANIIIASG